MDVSTLEKVERSRSLVENVSLEKYAVMQWPTQAINFITNIKVKVYFTLPALSMTNSVM